MDRDKQIEEMANIINEMDEPNAHYYDEILEQHEAFADCFTIAKHLYNAGYRKASEIAEEIFAEIEKQTGFFRKYMYANESVRVILDVLDTLKNKYAEDEG